MAGLKFGQLLCGVLCVVVLCSCSTIKPPKNARRLDRRMLATGYCKCGDCCNWKRTFYGKPVIKSGSGKGDRKSIGITANGTKAKPGTIAADTSKYPFGTVMHIPGYGYGRVEDRGSAIKGEHIDLFFKSHGQALEWGKQYKDVKIWIPR